MRVLFVLSLVMFAACDKPVEPTTTSSGDEPRVAPESATTQPSAAAESQRGWQEVAESTLDDVQRAQLAKASSAQQALGKTLLGALTASIGERGFAQSVEFCRGAAPDMAEKVGAEHGIAIGRTSHKLRNPQNAPPEWAAQTVASKDGGKHHFAGSDGSLGVLTPIMTAELCTKCHGGPDALADGVEAALTEKYPDDEATGFAVGELRGWFWVEVPGPS